MSKRPERLTYTGKQGESFAGVPRRNLDEQDIARLSDATLAEITTPHPGTGRPLYREPKSEAKAESKHEEPKAEKAEAKAE